MYRLLLLTSLLCTEVYAKTPPELVAEALLPRPETTLAGQPMGLGIALGSAALDRSRQLETIHSYWRLAEAVGHYGASADLIRQLEQIAPRTDDRLLVATAKASAVAALRDAELAAIAAQHELLIQAAMPPGVPPPLPADRPHVGSYRTNYQQLQVAQRLSARAGLIDQLLPLRRRALDHRAAAVSAAEEAAQAALAAYRGSKGDCPSVLARLADLRRQRLLFMTLVRQYNDDIADYALEIAPPTARGPALVGMLIEISPAGAPPAGYAEAPPAAAGIPLSPQPVVLPPTLSPVPGQTSAASAAPVTGGVVGTSATLPVPATGQPVPVIRPGDPLPTEPAAGAVPAATAPKASDAQEPAPLPSPPTPTFREPPTSAPAPRPSSGSRPGADSGSASDVAPDWKPDLKEVPIRPSSSGTRPGNEGPLPHKTNRPASESHSSAPAGVYHALVGLDAAAQARQLTAMLNSGRAAAEAVGRPLTLAECLSAIPATHRAAILDLYWRASEQAARYQTFLQQTAWLAAIEAGPAGALNAARQAAEAEQWEGRAALLEAEFQLAARLDWRQMPWPLPITQPHCGPCPVELKPLDLQRPEWQFGAELMALIPKLDQSVGEHAAATVAADQLRADLGAGFQAGRVPMERLIAAVHRQTDETLGLARALSDYNRAVGQYAAVTVPAQVPGAQLAALLVPGSVQVPAPSPMGYPTVN
jgi:hypothetical protein